MVNEFTFVWRIISHILDKLYDNYFKEDSHKLHIFLILYKQRGLRKTLISFNRHRELEEREHKEEVSIESVSETMT